MGFLSHYLPSSTALSYASLSKTHADVVPYNIDPISAKNIDICLCFIGALPLFALKYKRTRGFSHR